MSPFSVYCVICLGVFTVLINAAVVKNGSSKDFASQTTTAPVLEYSTQKPRPSERKKLSRRDRCCNLGREVAKIGETCIYSPNVDHIYPDSHYHQMKTSVWTRRSHPINRRLLHKCKPFKAFYEKCCKYEDSLIAQDLLRAKRKIKQYLQEIRRKQEEEQEEEDEDEGSVNVQGGLPEEQENTNKKHKYSS